MMRRRKVPVTLYAVTGGYLTQVGSTSVEVIEWTHPDGTRTHLVPMRLARQ